MTTTNTIDYQLTTSNNAMQSSGWYVPSTTTTFPWTNWNYNYSWPVGYATEARVAELEGEVKVLREMLAALLSGRPVPKQKRK